MAESAKSIVQMMKERISKSGKGQKDIFYVKKDGRVRVRFLTDLEEGVVIPFHTKWKEFNHPCLKLYGRNCPNCHNNDANTADNFVFTVWNYETKRTELFMYKATKCTPMPALVTMYETYGTICDRDYVISRQGEATDTVYTVVPMERKRFKGDEQPFSKKQIMKMLLKAYPPESEDEDEGDEDEEEIGTRKRTRSANSRHSNKKVIDEDEDDEIIDDDDGDEDEDEDNFDEKAAKRSKRKSRVISSSKKRRQEQEREFGDLSDFDEAEPDYESWTNKQLKAECKKRGFDYTGMDREQVIDMLVDDLPF